MPCKNISSSCVPIFWKGLTTLPTLEFSLSCLVTTALSWAEKKVMILEITQLFFFVREEAMFLGDFLHLERKKNPRLGLNPDLCLPFLLTSGCDTALETHMTRTRRPEFILWVPGLQLTAPPIPSSPTQEQISLWIWSWEKRVATGFVDHQGWSSSISWTSHHQSQWWVG